MPVSSGRRGTGSRRPSRASRHRSRQSCASVCPAPPASPAAFAGDLEPTGAAIGAAARASCAAGTKEWVECMYCVVNARDSSNTSAKQRSTGRRDTRTKYNSRGELRCFYQT